MKLAKYLIAGCLFLLSLNAHSNVIAFPAGPAYYTLYNSDIYPYLCTVQFPNGYFMRFVIYPNNYSNPFPNYTIYRCIR